MGGYSLDGAASPISDSPGGGTPAAASPALGSSGASKRGSVLLSVPKEVWRLCDVLYSRGLMTRGIFSLSGDAADLVLLRECLDTGDPFPAGIAMPTYAHCLVELLSSLREPVVPVGLFPAPADILRSHAAGASAGALPPQFAGAEAWCRASMRELPALHFHVLLYVAKFAREVLAQAAHNNAQLDNLSFVLSRCLFRRVAHDEGLA